MANNALPTAPATRFVAVCLIAAALPSFAGGFLFFPKPAETLSAETLPYTQMLHAGSENDTFYLRGRFGADFNLAGYRFGEDADGGGIGVQGGGRSVFFGVSAAAHINMRPESGGRFPVDNFYAVLALHLSGALSEKLSWRLYPLHHVSAHLADGHPIGAGEGIRAVSAEMARGELYYKPWGEAAEFGAAIGRYYHVCAQKELTCRYELSALLKPPAPYRLYDCGLSPYMLFRVENVKQGKDNFGAEAALGAVARRGGRGFGISLVYFNRLHRGYYFENYEEGFGAEFMFLL
jgi:hypothetical protein